MTWFENMAELATGRRAWAGTTDPTQAWGYR